MTAVVFALPGNEQIAHSLVTKVNAELGRFELRRFPDGESYVRIQSEIEARHVILVCTLDRPGDKFLPLIFLAAAAKDLGANRIGLISPYLGYMRQDRRFRPGEAVTSTYFGRALSGWFDWLLTVDPHLHRRHALSEVYRIPAKALHAAPLISAWIRSNVTDPVLVGPDSESEQWIAAVAHEAGAPHIVLDKIRRGDRDVEVSVPEVERWLRNTPVLVDDIISTASTMVETIRHLKQAGLPQSVCIGVHAVFAGAAYEELQTAGAGRIVTCNTIPHPTNAIDVTDLIASAIRESDRGVSNSEGL